VTLTPPRWWRSRRVAVAATALALVATTAVVAPAATAYIDRADAQPSAAARPSWYLAPGQTLASGRYLLSPNGQYGLFMQTDGNLVMRKISTKATVWASRSYGQPGARLVLQTNGNLVIWRGSQPVWSSRTAGRMLRLAVQNNGNLVLYTTTGVVAWTRQIIYDRLTAPNLIARGQGLFTRNRSHALLMQTDGNMVLYNKRKQVLWQTRTAGRTGAYARMNPDGNFVLLVNGKAIWSTRTSNHPGAVLTIQPNGNVVLYRGSRAVWQTGTGGR
jgi:hypothetical protein